MSNKLKIFDFRVYINTDTGEYESDVMETDFSKNKIISVKTRELFNLICDKSDKKLIEIGE